MSAQLLLAGLYPPHKEQIWTSEILWQPIPINDNPRTLDKVSIICTGNLQIELPAIQMYSILFLLLVTRTT